MFTPTFALQLTAAERAELDAMTRATRIPAGLARRARLILALAAGTPYDTITGALGFAPSSISRWKRRFHRARVMGLRDAPRGGRPDRLSPAREAKIIAATQRPPPAPYTHWSVRRLARRLGVSPATVHRVWQRAGLKPHRFGRYVASPDPDFEQKAADIIGLYLQPPAHAAVFCVDEKTAIQALDRRDPVLPRSPGIRVSSSWPSSISSWPPTRGAARSTSLPTTSRRIRPRRSPRGSPRIRASPCISRRPTARGSIKSSSGLRRSSATASRAASSRRPRICGAS